MNSSDETVVDFETFETQLSTMDMAGLSVRVGGLLMGQGRRGCAGSIERRCNKSGPGGLCATAHAFRKAVARRPSIGHGDHLASADTSEFSAAVQ
jgi:hypothetical protein